jgi:exosome complex component RRP4
MDSLAAESAHLKIVVPGDFIAQGVGLTAGHGTFESKPDDDEDDLSRTTSAGKIFASVAGVVHKIDNYISVKPLKKVYRPDIGDLVIGRIVSV